MKAKSEKQDSLALTESFKQSSRLMSEVFFTLLLCLAFFLERIGQFLQLHGHRCVAALGRGAPGLEIFQKVLQALLCGLECDWRGCNGVYVDRR
jgi:hypothetical protein